MGFLRILVDVQFGDLQMTLRVGCGVLRLSLLVLKESGGVDD